MKCFTEKQCNTIHTYLIYNLDYYSVLQLNLTLICYTCSKKNNQSDTNIRLFMDRTCVILNVSLKYQSNLVLCPVLIIFTNIFRF